MISRTKHFQLLSKKDLDNMNLVRAKMMKEGVKKKSKRTMMRERTIPLGTNMKISKTF